MVVSLSVRITINFKFQVDCFSSLCGMGHFYHVDTPDQWYRWIVALFASVGVMHLLLLLVLEVSIAWDLEKVNKRRKGNVCTLFCVLTKLHVRVRSWAGTGSPLSFFSAALGAMSSGLWLSLLSLG